ncbi:MAG: (Fe-S)-binding protein [Methanobacterium sp.]|nr:(Fe-S)-binding protein [Methanobacterium sp.]
MIYFRGCFVREKLNNISNATETILKKADLDYALVKNEQCCGSFLMRTGYKDDALEVMEKTIKQLPDNDEEILVSCAGCYNTLKNDYNKYLELN